MDKDLRDIIPLTTDFDRAWINPQVAAALRLPNTSLGYNMGANYIGESFFLKNGEEYILFIKIQQERHHNLYLPFEYKTYRVVPNQQIYN